MPENDNNPWAPGIPEVPGSQRDSSAEAAAGGRSEPTDAGNAGTAAIGQDAGDAGDAGEGGGPSETSSSAGDTEDVRDPGDAAHAMGADTGVSDEMSGADGSEAPNDASHEGGAGEAGGTGWPGWPSGPAPTMTTTAPGPDELAPLLMSVAPPQRQVRWTVLIRLVLTVPHFIVLYALGIAAEVILVIGWFGALFTGKLPDFAAEFLTGYLRWQARVAGYVLLLTDEWPPFTLADADYPVRIAVRPGRLNRLAVLFRVFLVIPAALIAWALTFGVAIVEFFAWLIVLIRGEMPRSLHLATAAALRYQQRMYGFEFMLTSAYPGGVFGDKAMPETTTEADFISGEEPPAEGPQAWKIVLTDSARNLVGLFLSLGALAAIGYVVLIAIVASHAGNTINTATNNSASLTIQSDFGPVNGALGGYATKAQACNQQIACLTALDRSEVAPLTKFASQLQATPVSGSQATNALNALIGSATESARAFSALGAAATPTAYNARLAQVQQALNKLGTDYQGIGTALQKTS